jgi:hypothetical protein
MIKTWQENISVNYPDPERSPELIQRYMQYEIDALRVDRDEWQEATTLANTNARNEESRRRDMQEQRDALEVVIEGYKVDQAEGIAISVKQQAEIAALQAQPVQKPVAWRWRIGATSWVLEDVKPFQRDGIEIQELFLRPVR